MTNISEPLRQFLTDWLAWAEGEAVDGEPFWRRFGLCRNAPDNCAIELMDLLHAELGTSLFPFGASAYKVRCLARTQHLDPNRLANRMGATFVSRAEAQGTNAMSDTMKDLITRIEAGSQSDNALDVLIEIVLFKPNTSYAAIRANAAKTKVIYTDHAGNEVTCWADDWTMAGRRSDTLAICAAALKARMV